MLDLKPPLRSYLDHPERAKVELDPGALPIVDPPSTPVPVLTCSSQHEMERGMQVTGMKNSPAEFVGIGNGPAEFVSRGRVVMAQWSGPGVRSRLEEVFQAPDSFPGLKKRETSRWLVL